MSTGRTVLTGTSKCIGRWVLEELLSRGHTLACLARSQAHAQSLEARGLEVVRGDLNHPAGLVDVLRGYRTVIHIPNLASMTALSDLLRAYENAGIRRAIFISSTGIFTTINARTKPLRLEAERVISGSKLDFTILRPTLVYGDADDNNMSRLLHFCQRFPIMPIFGSGRALQQPLHVGDLAWAVAEVLGHTRTYRRAYNLGGGQTLTYNQLVTLTYRLLGKRGTLLHLPTEPIAFMVQAAEKLGLRLPLREEQIRRLQEDKAYDTASAKEDFGFAPRSFETGLAQEVQLIFERRDRDSARSK